MSYFIAAQLVGVLTAVVSIIIVQFKKIRWILVGEVFSNLLISVSYALVGGWLLNGQSRILCKPKIQLQNDGNVNKSAVEIYPKFLKLL